MEEVCELKQPIWGIIGWKGVWVMHLTYAQAEQKMPYIQDTGATIVTDEVACKVLESEGKA